MRYILPPYFEFIVSEIDTFILGISQRIRL